MVRIFSNSTGRHQRPTPAPSSLGHALSRHVPSESAQLREQEAINSRLTGESSHQWVCETRRIEPEMDSIPPSPTDHAPSGSLARVIVGEGDAVHQEFLALKRHIEMVDHTARDWDVTNDGVLLDLIHLLMVKWIEESRVKVKDVKGAVTTRYMTYEQLQLRAKGLSILWRIHRRDETPSYKARFRMKVLKRRIKLRDQYNLHSTTRQKC